MAGEPCRVLFSGYAPVHTLCFLPVYRELQNDPGVEVFFSGGFRVKEEDGERYDLNGFYGPMGIDPSRVLPLDQALEMPFDVAVCSHTSDTMLPGQVGRTVQIFHGVSFKNFSVRDKVLVYDDICISGRYHEERFRSQGLIRPGGSRFLLTGFAKTDDLVRGDACREAVLSRLGLDPSLPTVLFAPTGGKHNALERFGPALVREIRDGGRWNLVLKPHDHPKRPVDWPAYESLQCGNYRVTRDPDVIPLLKSADLLLTDASSVAVEYTLLDRPIVFADVPKLFANVRKRGAPLDLETHGRNTGPVAGSPAEVVKAIGESLENPERYSDRRRAVADHVFYDPGRASGRVADVIRHAAGLLPSLPKEVEVIAP